jgi:hypothetical protein
MTEPTETEVTELTETEMTELTETEMTELTDLKRRNGATKNERRRFWIFVRPPFLRSFVWDPLAPSSPSPLAV